MDSSVSAKDEIWFLRVCPHVSNAVYTYARNVPFQEAQGQMYGLYNRIIHGVVKHSGFQVWSTNP